MDSLRKACSWIVLVVDLSRGQGSFAHPGLVAGRTHAPRECLQVVLLLHGGQNHIRPRLLLLAGSC